ncbi:MAG: hypothetical protein NTW10_08140 [Bacteroidetes bacterium]|nr:hypothetical protein [Bacteroidota bacterium]
MKKAMNKILVLFLLAGMFVTSCSKSSDTPTAITRTSLVGKWTEQDSKKKLTFEVTFAIDSTSSSGMWIYNFGGAGQSVKATVYLSGNSLVMPKDELFTNGWIVNGNGSITSATGIDWPFTYLDLADLNSVHAVFTKK